MAPMSVGRMPINGGLNPVRLVSYAPLSYAIWLISHIDWHRTPRVSSEIPFSLPQAKVQHLAKSLCFLHRLRPFCRASMVILTNLAASQQHYCNSAINNIRYCWIQMLASILNVGTYASFKYVIISSSTSVAIIFSCNACVFTPTTRSSCPELHCKTYVIFVCLLIFNITAFNNNFSRK